MPRIFSNPRAFANECANVNVTLDLLLESQLCVGKQCTARFFQGRCRRGDGESVSSALIEDWIETLMHVRDHPDEKDDDSYQLPRSILPKEEWHAFVKLVHVPIEDELIESWSRLSKSALGKEAPKYGITFGIANFKALENIHERMLDMVERRRRNFWNCTLTKVADTTDEYLKTMNMYELKAIAKNLGITALHVTKEPLIAEIETRQRQMQTENNDIFTEAYEEMSMTKLKFICKERNVPEYIQKSKDELIVILNNLDKEIREQEDRVTLGNVEIHARPGDHYINVTQLCKAGGREFYKWNENEVSKEFVHLLGEKLNMTREQLIVSLTDGSRNDRGTWVHPRIAIQIAQWISPIFALNVSGWVEKLLSTGTVSLERPLQKLLNLTDIDMEAIELEKTVHVDEFTRCGTIYVAYIGRGLVKVGFSDGNIVRRNDKHTSSESQYPQYRILKLIRVSGRPMERDLHKELFPYQVSFNRQKEVFQPRGTLAQFIERIEQFLHHHDILLRYGDLQEEHQKLEQKLLRIKVWALENGITIPI